MEIPIEDWEPGDEDKVARLKFSLYETRDAAQNLAEEYSKRLEALGFVTGRATPCNFQHDSKKFTLRKIL